MDPKESYRIHLDWWGECRTCVHWSGDRIASTGGKCEGTSSPNYGYRTFTSGNCQEWDSFDTDTALQVMEDDQPK